jgi:hypothetical protein
MLLPSLLVVVVVALLAASGGGKQWQHVPAQRQTAALLQA